MVLFHGITVDQALKELKVDKEKGLDETDAQRRLQRYGPNELPSEEGSSFWALVLEQFDDQLVKILLAAALVSFILALLEEGEDQLQAFTEPAVIMTILILNAIVGVVQESNAEAAIEALKEYQVEEATVVRERKTRKIPAKELVPGDIVLCDVGVKVPADMRVVEILTSTLKVEQAALTGESVEKGKQVEPVANPENSLVQDKENILFSGTDVTRGKVIGVVISTGSNTEIGKISKKLSESDKTRTPLQQKLDDFGEMLSKVIMWICIAVWLINIGHFNDPVHGGSWVKGAIYYFKIAVALAVAAIPEGLPAVVTTCLALGTRKMAKKNAIVRSLPSVETLGCTSVICSDKTGTLTTNKMSVRRVLTFGKGGKYDELEVRGEDYAPTPGSVSSEGIVVPESRPLTGLAGFGKLCEICAVCNDSKLVWVADQEKFDRIGEPTEAALKTLVEKLGLPSEVQSRHGPVPPVSDRAARASYATDAWVGMSPRVSTLEFTRRRKSMSVLVKNGSSTSLLVKGAPESILDRSDKLLMNDGSVVALTDELRGHISTKLSDYSKKALRCLAMAYVPTAPPNMDLADDLKFESYESHMVFVGIVGMLDPPRSEVRGAVAKCHAAGIRVVVITGDNKNTAESICRDIGVFGQNENLEGKSFTGREFDQLTPSGKANAVMRGSLFARTEPTHKEQLVKLLQSQGNICAMTGDGVNDAQALKSAEIGVAMGSGTAVAKGVGDMVLADDNFATIVSAVEEGRAIFSNTKQFIRYLISSNIGEVACIFMTAALGLPESLIPVQLLWVNLVTDGLPATALGFNKPDKDIMMVPPRDSKEGIVDSWLFFRYMVIGLYVGIGTVGGFVWWYLMFEEGPQIQYSDLANWSSCAERDVQFNCDIFTGVAHHHASTVSLSILVTIEMFNAANALSENQSLLVQPIWTNIWLVLAMLLSFGLHFVILYVPAMADIFQVVPLSWEEWKIVLMWSSPVLLIDEVLKLVARLRGRGTKVFVEHVKKD